MVFQGNIIKWLENIPTRCLVTNEIRFGGIPTISRTPAFFYVSVLLRLVFYISISFMSKDMFYLNN